MLAGQQIRLHQGAKAWNTAVAADRLGVIYRRWREKAEKTTKPWFGGYSHRAALSQAGGEGDGSATGGVGDIEDMTGRCSSYARASAAKDRFHATMGAPFLPPQLKWHALGVLSVVVAASAAYVALF